MNKLKLFIEKLAQVKIIHYLSYRNKTITMKAKLGQHYYAPHRCFWGVWVWDYVSETGATGKFIKDFRTKEEAREYVWVQNGWGKPSKKLSN